MVFKLRNKDAVSRRVRIVQPETNLFRIALANDSEDGGNAFFQAGNKVAPGLEIPFVIRFSPEAKNDYNHELVIVTEREKFVVPIFAIGKKSLLDFPDAINFGSECPVKYSSEKSVMLHNRGEKSTKWEIRLPDCFTADKTEGVLDENSTEQILFRFFPLQKRLYETAGQLIYDGDSAEFNLKGVAINGDVRLSVDSIQLDETYISLESKQTFKIYNKSHVKIDFEWRAFSSEREEEDKKKLLLDQLEREEEEKRKGLNEIIDFEDNIENQEGLNNKEDSHFENVFEDSDESQKEKIAKKRRRAEIMLERKYRAIKKAVEEDRLTFEDDIFLVQPISGSIWPNSEMIITVVFKPRSALKYTNQAFCNVSCSDERLLLNLEGEGLGPKAFLSTNILSIGDIFVNDKQSFNIYIENKGEIPTRFSLAKNGSMSTGTVNFDLEDGLLAVGQRMNILLTFQSFRVGEFQEMFRWQLRGSSEQLTLLVRGHVRAPRFEFDRKIIDFKKVSFQFEEVQELVLTNTSSVNFHFALRIPQDGKGSSREFEIVPSSDLINAGETKKIQVKFIPQYRKIYNCSLVLDMENIGKDMKSIPIMAESEVPVVRLGSDSIDFGEIFLRYPQTREIELINESKLFARFIVHHINPKFAAFGKITTDLDKGQIPPESSLKLNVGLTTCCLKNFQIDLIIEVVSDIGAQHLIKIRGNSIGPIVEISHKEIDFGNVEVLKKYTKKVTITNKSIIEADFYAFTKTKNSIFKPIQRHHILQPGQAFDVDVVCLPDDPQKFADTLFFVIKEGMDKEIKLKARGIGSTIFCKDLGIVSFGTIFTHRTQMQEVFIENKGRRTQTLKWTRKIEAKVKIEEKMILNTASTNQIANAQNQHVFSIQPENIVLPPKTGLMFQFKAFTTEIGKISEQFILSSSIGSEKKSANLFTSTFEGEFIKPQLVFSNKSINFQYIWNKDAEPTVLSQKLEVSCASPLPVSFSVFTEAPFSVSPDNVSLLPGKKIVLQIDFDPTLKKDKNSGKISEKLWIKHFKHPKNETFPLTAEYCYPNLELSSTDVDFGAVMNDTVKKCSISMKNISAMPLSYCWYFVEQQGFAIENQHISEIFDILPLKGIIEPDKVEQVEFTYFAASFQTFEVTAVCKVEGGPDYPVSLHAEASNVEYHVIFPKKNKVIDIGETFLGSKSVNDFEIENTSKVSFDFSLKLDLTLPRSKIMADFISFAPAKGSLAGGDKIKIRVSMSPGLPGPLYQTLVLQIAHFEPERISIRGYGLFPSLRFDVARKTESDLLRMIKKITDRKQNVTSQEEMSVENKSEIISSESREQMESLNFVDESDNIIVDSIQNLHESMISNINDEVVTNLEKEIIKAFIKRNKTRVSSVDKGSFRSTNRSQNKIVSSIQVISDENTTKSKFTKGNFKFFEEIVLATYVLNMGTIIAGNKTTNTVTIKNIGKCFTSFSIDMKNYKQMGLSISNTKVHKLACSTNNTIEIHVNLQTKKTTKPGKMSFSVPVNIENGGRYILEVVAFITIPELNISETEIDFGGIQVGLAKLMYLRVENTKSINCDWQVICATKTASKSLKKKEDVVPPKFIVSPTFGQLLPGARQTIEVLFEPLENKAYEEVLTFAFKDSTKKIDLICKGQGVVPHIEFLPHNLIFSPCMPRETIFRNFAIKNNSDFDIGMIWSDKDSLVCQEENIISNLHSNQVKTAIRKINEPFWQDLKEEAEINSNNRSIEKELANLEKSNPHNKEELKNQLLLKLQKKAKPTIYPQKIDFEKQDNVIIISNFKELPEKAALLIQKEFSKCQINLKNLLEWNMDRATTIGQKVFQQVEAKKAELDSLVADRNRKIKQKKVVPDLDVKNFCNISKEDFEALIVERINIEDCNAGVCLYNLECGLIDKESAFEVLSKVLAGSNVYALQIVSKGANEMMESNVSTVPEGFSQDFYMEKKNIFEFMRKRLTELNCTDTEHEEEFEKTGKEDIFEVDDDFSNSNVNLENFEHSEKFYKIKLMYLENLHLLKYQLQMNLPKPQFPDPNYLPLPEPLSFQIVKKTTNPHKIITSNKFEVLTLKNETNEEHEELTEQNYLKLYDSDVTRWTIKAKSTLNLQVKFVSESLGEFSENFLFENFSTIFNGLHKGYTFSLKSSTQYPSILKNIINIFPNRRKSRVKGQIVKKEFVTQENAFDFGPLLVFDASKIERQTVKKRHSSVLRFTNTSPYPVHLSFSFMSHIQDFSHCPGLKSSKNVFEVEPKESVAQIGETVNVRVWAFPKERGAFTDSLICSMKNNPSPFIANVKCDGVLPDILVNNNELSFERILVDKKTSNSFDISNIVPVDIKWKITNFQELTDEGFVISKQSGVLEISQKQTIDVAFSSSKQERKRCVLEVEAEDTQSLNVYMRETKKIVLNAEAFKASVSFTGLKNNDKMAFDFGQTIVGFPIETTIGIKNEGIYSLKYQFEIPKQSHGSFFEISPSTAELKPGMSQSVNVKFLAEKEVIFDEKQRDVGLQLKLIERDDVFNQILFTIKAESQYSKLSIEPSKHLNFGPIIFSESKMQTFDIVNNGQFEFAYELFDNENSSMFAEIVKRFELIKQEQQLQRTKTKDQTIPAIKAPKAKGSDKLQISQFSISPCNGVVAPNSSQKIEVVFKGSGLMFFESKIGIAISNSNFQNNTCPTYLLQAESCVPILETKNFRSIFEEQVVTQSLTSTGVNIQSVVNSNVFCVEENTFYFGNLIPTKNPMGTTEKIKIINTGKVFANVKFDVAPKNSSLNGFEVSPRQARINPHESIYVKIVFKPEIMAHYESIFTALVENGNPTHNDCKLSFDLKGDGTFPSIRVTTNSPNVATNGGETILDFGKVKLDKTKGLIINVKNIGVIPATFQCNLAHPGSIFRMGSLNERTLMPLEVYPFQVEFAPKDLGINETKICFTTLMNPYEKNLVAIRGEATDELFSIETADGDGTIIDFGDLVFSNSVPEPDNRAWSGSEKLAKRTFLIRNNANETIKLEVSKPDDAKFIDIKPNKAHVGPKMTKKFTVYFLKPSILSNNSIAKDISIKALLIAPKIKKALIQQLANWDDTKVTKKMVSEVEATWVKTCENMRRQFTEDKKLNPKLKEPLYPTRPVNTDSLPASVEIKELIPEPEFELITEKQYENRIKINARIDVPKISFEKNAISFLPTKMFTSRVYSFKTFNESSINVAYEWDFLNPSTGLSDAGAFSIIQPSGTLSKNSFEEFTLRFAPQEYDSKPQRILVLKIGKFSNTESQLKISLDADIERPICHFELPFSVSEMSDKMVEIESVGVNTKITKKFYVLNPTAFGYEFVWISHFSQSSQLKCLTPKGIILPNKKFEMLFEFTPTSQVSEIQDMNCTFTIPQFAISEHILFRTKILQPKVFFTTSKIDFGPLLLSGKSKETIFIKNLDNISYNFSFVKSSLKSLAQEQGESLKIHQLSGILLPNQDTPITITFSPKLETDFNYNIQVTVPQKKEPLNLNVKGRGYKLHHELKLNNCMLDSGNLHKIDFGETFVYETQKQSLQLFNSGEFNIDFVVDKKPHSSIIITPETGTVRKGEVLLIDILFQPIHTINLNSTFQLQIVSGSCYNFQLSGFSKVPLVEFNPKIIDFGEVVLKKSGISKSINLEFKNQDKKTLSLQTDFIKNDFLELQIPAEQSLLATENENSLIVPFIFRPKKDGKLNCNVCFYINNRHKIEIPVKGEAISCLFGLVNPQDISVDFGSIPLNTKQTRQVFIKNFSKIPIKINFDVDGQRAKLASLGLSISPQCVMIDKKSSAPLDICFYPTQRQRQFSFELQYELLDSGDTENILTILGACYSAEVKIMEDSINFNQVVLNSFLSKRLQILNTGDLVAEFNWNITSFGPYFSVLPKRGSIMPGEQLMCDITFSPTVQGDFKVAAQLLIAGVDSPFVVSLSSKGISAPASSTENLQIETSVRSKTVKSISVKNPTGALWTLRPVVTTSSPETQDYFSVPKTFEVPPNSQGSVQLSYLPLTVLPNPQSARLFVPLPDGTALSYQIEGKVLPPKPESAINLNLKAKTHFSHSVLVSNWLPVNQRFAASFELNNSQDPISNGILINSSKAIDIPANVTQNFKFSLFVLKRGTYSLGLLLKNKLNNEFMHFPITLNVEEAPTISSFDMSCTVREMKTQRVTIENPLPTAVTIQPDKITIDAKDVFLKSTEPLTILPNSEGYLEFIFRPLLIYKNQKGFVKINSDELGLFTFEFSLTSEKCLNSPTLTFKSHLGNDEMKAFNFINYLGKQALYTCKLDKVLENDSITAGPSDFFCETQTVNVLPANKLKGTEASINIRFEPSSIGWSKALLTLSNPEGGDYSVYLVGTSSAPLPKGPFKITQKGLPIDFKNPFFEAREFFVKFDNPSFSCSIKSPFRLEAKKSMSLPIVFKGSADNSTGRILIETKDQIVWVIFLQGLL